MSFGKVGCSLAIGVLAALLWQADARAQTAATCSFNATTALVTVTVDGMSATVSRAGGGAIRLNGVGCGGATTLNTNRIVIRGGALRDVISMSGVFEPGLTAETGVSEIEVHLTGIEAATWALSGGDDTLVFLNGGIDVGGDGDVDVTGNSINNVQGRAGDDFLDFSARGGSYTLGGGAGNDEIIGGSGNNTLLGGADDDTLRGNAGNDHLEGGPGNDVEFGGGGIDRFDQQGAANGSDFLSGGAGIDTADYGGRAVGVNVTLAAGGEDDGEPGEADEVSTGVENVIGGDGDDVIVGSNGRNRLQGGAGNDELLGGANDDDLLGEEGDDFLQGDAGANDLRGGDGNDVLVGGPQTDQFFGEAGDDEITGNTDGRQENVNCGDGIDTAESNDEDNFIACEV